MDRYKIAAWVAVIISLVLLILPRVVPICPGLGGDGSPMRCHYAYQAEFIVTLLAVILAGSLLVVRTAEARLLNGFVVCLLGAGIIVLLQPWAVGICPHGGACHKTAFFTTIGGGLLALAGAFIAWLSYKKQREEAQ